MSHRATPVWEMGLEAIVDATLLNEGVSVDRATRQRVGEAVRDSVRAMPELQRRVVQAMVARRGPGRGHRPRGVWLLTTSLPGMADVGRALGSLAAFHTWSEIADPMDSRA